MPILSQNYVNALCLDVNLCHLDKNLVRSGILIEQPLNISLQCLPLCQTHFHTQRFKNNLKIKLFSFLTLFYISFPPSSRSSLFSSMQISQMMRSQLQGFWVVVIGVLGGQYGIPTNEIAQLDCILATCGPGAPPSSMRWHARIKPFVTPRISHLKAESHWLYLPHFYLFII